MAKKAAPPEIGEPDSGILSEVVPIQPRSRVSDRVAESVRLIGLQGIAARVFRRRVLFGALTIAAISIVSFFLSDLPPTRHPARSHVQDASPSTEKPRMLAAVRVLERDHGLDRPLPVRYLKWAAGFVRGDLGHAFVLNVPLEALLLYRLPSTASVFLATLACTCLLAMATAIYSTKYQSTFRNRTLAVVGFLGLATPVLLLLPWVLYSLLWLVIAVSFYYYLPWLTPFQHVMQFAYSSVSELRLWHLAVHVPVLLIVLAISGSAGLIARAIRAALLGELARNYPINAGNRPDGRTGAHAVHLPAPECVEPDCDSHPLGAAEHYPGNYSHLDGAEGAYGRSIGVSGSHLARWVPGSQYRDAGGHLRGALQPAHRLPADGAGSAYSTGSEIALPVGPVQSAKVRRESWRCRWHATKCDSPSMVAASTSSGSSTLQRGSP